MCFWSVNWIMHLKSMKVWRIHVTEGSDSVEDFSNSIKLLPVFSLDSKKKISFILFKIYAIILAIIETGPKLRLLTYPFLSDIVSTLAPWISVLVVQKVKVVSWIIWKLF